jgi:hypothetical protein
MKNSFNKTIFLILFITSSLMADYSFDVTSLIGVDGGYGSLDAERSDNNSSNITKYSMPYGGVKVGAQTKEFRIFLGLNYYSADDFDYVTTYGASLQYLINVTSYFNLFLGVNTGVANMRYLASKENKARTVSDSYYGLDTGANIHLGKSFDFELGVRYMSIGAENTINNVTYRFDNMLTGYSSIIYRFKMD